MDNELILSRILTAFKNDYAALGFKKSYYEDKNSFTNFVFCIDDHLAIVIKADRFDGFISFFMIRLNNGKPYGVGYYRNQEGEVIRLYCQDILQYFHLPCDKVKAKQLAKLRSNTDLFQQIEEGLAFYRAIFHNENNLIEALHKQETWEQIHKIP